MYRERERIIIDLLITHLARYLHLHQHLKPRFTSVWAFDLYLEVIAWRRVIFHCENYSDSERTASIFKIVEE